MDREELDFIIMPMFASENTVEMGKSRSKCKLCKEVMKDDKVFGHFEKIHKKEFEKFALEHQEFMEDELFNGLEENDFFDEMFFSGMTDMANAFPGKQKNLKKKK
jgi:hypothetical protein